MKKFIFPFMMLVAFAMLSGCASSVPENTQPATETTLPSETEADTVFENPSDVAHFTNKFGTPQTICAHSGCNNTIASTGDTNCCTRHSAKCLNCGKYIDEDATYCMECLKKSITKSSEGSSTKSHSSTANSGNKCHYKEGDTEVCSNTCAPGSNFCSYHKKLLDDIYGSLTGK